MIHNPLRSDLLQIHPSAFEMDADKHIEPILIGAHSNIQNGMVIHSKSGAIVEDGYLVRFKAVVDGSHLTAGFHVPSTVGIERSSDLARLPKVSVDASKFSEDVARTNNELVLGYKRIQNEF